MIITSILIILYLLTIILISSRIKKISAKIIIYTFEIFSLLSFGVILYMVLTSISPYIGFYMFLIGLILTLNSLRAYNSFN